MDEFAEDYADRTVHEIDKLVMAFCTPLGGTVDEALVKHVYAKVRSIFVDGALVKVAQYLRATKMPNVVLICRDPGHMLRIAMKDPLIRSNRFGAQHERLFGKNGLLKQVQFSDGLQARLEECQRIVLRHAGHQGGNLRHVMRHFSFAAHRFESMNEPRRKYACVLHAVVLLLADMAGDSRRTKDERKRAEDILDAMTTQDLLETGLAGDFCECAMRALRRFDVADPDPALASTAVADFADSVRKLFVDGYILMAPDEPGLMTLTQIVLEQCSDIREFRYGERVKVLWSKTTKEECEETLRDIATVAADMLDRCRADFNDNDLYMQFEAMHVEAWRLARQQGHDAPKLYALRRKARHLHATFGLRWDVAEWDAIITAGIRELAPDPKVDNRVLWSRVLSLPDDAPAHGPARRIELLIRFYLSLAGGSGCVERLLGRHAAFLACHGPGALSEACVEIETEGPAEDVDVASRSDGRLLLTPFSRQCAELWVIWRGRRFGAYKQRSDAGRLAPHRFPGSLRAVQAKTRAAMDNLVRQAQRDPTPGTADVRKTILGHRRCDLLKGASRLKPIASKPLANFRKTTADRLKTKKSAVGLWRGFDKTLPARRQKEGLRLPTMVGAPQPRLAARQLGAAKRALAKSQGKGSSGSGTIGAIDKATAVSTAAALESDIIHVDDDLPAAPLDSKVLSVWLQAVACGKTVAVKQNKTHLGLKAAVKRPASVRLTDAFAAKHKSLTVQLRRILKLPASKWREVSTGGDTIGDLSGMRSFLVKMQRRPLICGVGGPLAMPLAVRGRVSRYGRPVAA